MRFPPYGRRTNSLSLPRHSSRTSRMSKVRFPVLALSGRRVGNLLSPALAPDTARLPPFWDERVFFSQAMIAGEPLPQLTNFHDILTNIHQTPSTIAGAVYFPRLRCVLASAPGVVRRALAAPSQE